METMASHNEGKTSQTINSLDMSDNLPGQILSSNGLTVILADPPDDWQRHQLIRRLLTDGDSFTILFDFERPPELVRQSICSEKVVLQSAPMTALDIQRTIEKMEHSPRRVVINYLQLIPPRCDGNKGGKQLEEILLALRNMARQKQMPVIVFAMSNHKVDGQDTLSFFRECPDAWTSSIVFLSSELQIS